MTRTIEYTRTFKKDFKREQKIATGKRLDLEIAGAGPNDSFLLSTVSRNCR